MKSTTKRIRSMSRQIFRKKKTLLILTIIINAFVNHINYANLTVILFNANVFCIIV